MSKKLSPQERRRLIESTKIDGYSLFEAAEKAGGIVALARRMNFIAVLKGEPPLDLDLYEDAISLDQEMGWAETQ